jgi:putative sterol carrier protein
MSEESPRAFYTERIPAQFNRALTAQEAAGEDGARVLADMKAVNATLCAEVQCHDGGPFFLNIENGTMHAADTAARPPFLTLRQDRSAFERLAAEAGESAMAMLGGLSGLAGEMKLTASRIKNLEAVNGLLSFEVTGDEGFRLLTHFGAEPFPDEPACSITVAPDAYADLRSGTLDPQSAFLNGKIEVSGEMQLAMQLALAALSPD